MVTDEPKPVKELGILPTNPPHWQNIAKLPEKQFEELIGQTKPFAGQSIAMSAADRLVPSASADHPRFDPRGRVASVQRISGGASS